MTPIVSLAAVLFTYLAFLKQVEANKIQSKQFNKTIKDRIKDEKTTLKNSIELLSLDIDFTIKDIKNRIEFTKEFCNRNPYDENPLADISSTCLDRYKDIDRIHLYHAFKEYISEENTEEIFRNTYSLLDYYNDSVKNYRCIYNDYMEDISKEKEQTLSNYKSFRDLLISARIKTDFIKLFSKETTSNKILEIGKLKNFLNDYEKKIVDFCDKIKDIDKELSDKIYFKYITLCDSTISIEQQRNMLNNILIKEKESWEEILPKIENISNVLHSSLNKISKSKIN